MAVYKMTRGRDGRLRVAAIDPGAQKPSPEEEGRKRLEEKQRVREAAARAAAEATAASVEPKAEPEAPERAPAETPAKAPAEAPATGSYPCPDCGFVAASLPGLSSHRRARHGG